ncbi:MAG: MFS transporter [Thermomicrobiales bacterium]|nr:MFS transporter [Thermomicrobiales bacterium]MCO5222377.1 MFS transporter [Thermomicrobiales bacterium]
MSGTEIRRFSDDQSLIGGRWIVALLQSISSSLASGLILPVVVLAAYVALLTNDLYRVALIPVLVFGLWNLGALVAASICRERSRLMPWAFAAGAVRAVAVAAMAQIAYQAGAGDDGSITRFLIAAGVFGVASGFTSVPLEGLLQKSFESSSRAQLFTGRAFWGVLAALVSGVVIRSVFQPDGPEVQRAFAYLFIAAAGCFASATFFTLLIKEPARRLSTARHGRGVGLLSSLGDRAMQRYLLFRIALAAAAMLDVFIIVYAARELTFDRTFIGIYVIAFCAALALALPLCRSLANRRGGRAVLQAAVWLKLIAPVVLLTIPYLRDSADVAERVSGDRFFLWMIVVCFVALGASLALQSAGNFQYLSEIAPATNRDGYFSTTNLVLMVTALFPLLGAWIVDSWGFDRLFGVTGAIALLAVLLSGILVDKRTVASRPATATRLTRLSVR